MPAWFRKPSGTYARSTPDWYAHQRGRASGLINATLMPAQKPCVGLYNNSSPSVYLHVIGVMIQNSAPASVWAKYLTGAVPPADSGATGYASVSVPLYSNDPTPPGVVQLGFDPNLSEEDATLLEGSPVYWYPPWELAVIAPGDTWEFYTNQVNGTLEVMFDWIWMLD